MSKKRIYILISIIIIIGVTISGYLLFKKGNNKETTDPTNGEYQVFDPFGTSITQTGLSSTNQISKFVKEDQRFFRLTDSPISGAGFFEEKIQTQNNIFENTPFIRYINKSNGSIYNINLKNKIKNMVSGSVIPRIHESFLGANGYGLIYRYLSWNNDNTISTFVSMIGAKEGEFLENNIIDMSLSKDKNKYFYLVKTNEGVIGYIKNFTNQNKTEVFVHPFSEWISQWVNDQKIYLTTKASYLSKGIIFEYDISNKKLTKILNGNYGFTTLASQDGTKILFSEQKEGEGVSLKIFNIEENKTIETKLKSLPEKCIWSKNNIYIYCAVPNKIKSTSLPDEWYQGLVSFEDSFIKIDSNSGIYETIFNSETLTPVDAINLFMSHDEKQIFFTNKKDYTLWGLKIEE